MFDAKHFLIVAASVVIGTGLSTGCESSTNSTVKEASVDVDYKVRIERSAPRTTVTASSELARDLAFEVTGFAPNATGKAAADSKSAVTQAAILDALVKALVEARRGRGQTTGDFTMKLGPRVTIVHRQIGDGYEAQISLIARGVDTTFVVRNGALMHEPYDLKLLRQVFDETNGEFSLLSTNWKPAQGGCEARVACYEPTGLAGSIAGDPSEKTVPSP